MSIKKWIQQFVRFRGYDVRWTPNALARHPEARLEVTVEMVIARRYLEVQGFYFVQVGAFDGVCVDPIGAMMRRLGCRGLMIEPHPVAFARLEQTVAGRSGVELLQAAVSDRDGELPFYSLDPAAPDAPSKAPLISSLDRGMLERELGTARDWSPWIRETRVRCTTLNHLLEERNISRLDLLQIDAEGYDARILRVLDFARWSPVIINFEHALLPQREAEHCWQMLAERGYLLHVSPPDTLAVLASAAATTA